MINFTLVAGVFEISKGSIGTKTFRVILYALYSTSMEKNDIAGKPIFPKTPFVITQTAVKIA